MRLISEVHFFSFLWTGINMFISMISRNGSVVATFNLHFTESVPSEVVRQELINGIEENKGGVMGTFTVDKQSIAVGSK